MILGYTFSALVLVQAESQAVTPNEISPPVTVSTPSPNNPPRESSYTLTPSLQVRPRLEKSFEGPIGVPPAPGAFDGNAKYPNFRMTQRSRAGLKLNHEDLRAQVSVQDVRTWGSETDTSRDFVADALDVHEAWAEIGHDLTLRVGRQEVAFDEDRLLGTADWAQQGRSYDAIRVDYKANQYGVALLWTRLQNDGLLDMLVARGFYDAGFAKLSIPIIFESNAQVAQVERDKIGQKTADFNRLTAGTYVKGQSSGVDFRAEAYVQKGKDNNTGAKQLAYMAAVTAGYKMSSFLHPAFWVDYLSGDNNHADNTTHTFDTLYGTGHKYYGYIDRFLNIPIDTRNGGLIDIAIKNNSELGPGKLHVAVHEFFLASENSAGAKGAIGAELDAVYMFPVVDKVNVHVGGAIFLDQGDFRAANKAASADNIHDWVYAELNVAL